MEALVCKNCGSGSLTRKNNYLYCPYCDSRYAVTKEDHSRGLFSHPAGGASSIELDADVERLLNKCRTDPKNARRYANLILDIDPDNEDALTYLRK